MTLSLKRRRALPGHPWLGTAFFLCGLSVWSAGCGGSKESSVATKPAPAKTETPKSESPPIKRAEADLKETQPAVTQKTEAPPADAPKPDKPAPEKAPAKIDSRPAHLIALEKMGATVDYGSGDRLIEVDLDGKPVTDADLDNLAPLTDLKILNLSGSRITDEGLAKLAPLKRLKFLYLFKTDITDAGIAHLKELPRLEVLCLDQTLITDAGVKSLEGMPRLEKLHVHSRAPITDASVDSLSKHLRLFELKIGGPGFTEKGINRLREALPNCTVQYDPKMEATEG